MVVIKRGGRKQSFSPAKIKRSIEKTAKDAHVPAAKRKELLKEVALPIIKLYQHKRVKSTDLRKAILRRLSSRSKATVAEWKKYDRKKKR